MERNFSRGPGASWQDVTPGKLDENGKESRCHDSFLGGADFIPLQLEEAGAEMLGIYCYVSKSP
jgi:hypothetical protein